jgi:hypothetical protein
MLFETDVQLRRRLARSLRLDPSGTARGLAMVCDEAIHDSAPCSVTVSQARPEVVRVWLDDASTSWARRVVARVATILVRWLLRAQ